MFDAPNSHGASGFNAYAARYRGKVDGLVVYLSDDRAVPPRRFGPRAIRYGCYISALSALLAGSASASLPLIICDSAPVPAQPSAIATPHSIHAYRGPVRRPVGIAGTAHPIHHRAMAARRTPAGPAFSTSCHAVALVGALGPMGFGLPRGFPGTLGGPAQSYAGSMSPVPGSGISGGFPRGGYSPAPILPLGGGPSSPAPTAHAPMPPIPIGPEQSLYPPLLPVSFPVPPASDYPGGQVPPGFLQAPIDTLPPDTAPPTASPPADTNTPVATLIPATPIPATPVPEPPAITIFLAGVALVIALRCRPRRKRRSG